MDISGYCTILHFLVFSQLQLAHERIVKMKNQLAILEILLSIFSIFFLQI